ncbi:MAG: hypothetical protein CSA20_03895 [Deltaproteobacteria bacterium]|nr:MAG: hypothetical protein CSB23_01240 [Deltaproteobacteria bacterium]PIE73236.1 MAG: hypothetical protein CSA20_03895 [Deltaproteobacteria bacterium]
MVPEFAILGHPNEGKSSVLSTLAEDDSVRVSPTPGETTACQSFPVLVDGVEMLRFTDTPGFQNPDRVLSELKNRFRNSLDPLKDFRLFAEKIPELADDRELLLPLARGAGILYIVDGSRPVRNVDRAEMEILRLTGKPRMAIINNKSNEHSFLSEWKLALRKNFNTYRLFNAHRATYAERIDLLEALKAIDQDWQDVLDTVLTTFKKDWQTRNSNTADIIIALLREAATLQLTETLASGTSPENARARLLQRYNKSLRDEEKNSHQAIKQFFKHNIFDYQLPPQSLVNEDLFAEKTWQILGLTKKQIVIAGGLGGAVLGVGLEAATFGHSLGIFTAVGTAAGALGAWVGGEKLSNSIEVLGLPLGGEQLRIGPTKSINLLFVLLNRSLLFYQHTINWAHGRRDYENVVEPDDESSGGMAFTSDWPAGKIQICQAFFKAAQKTGDIAGLEKKEQALKRLLLQTMDEIAQMS